MGRFGTTRDYIEGPTAASTRPSCAPLDRVLFGFAPGQGPTGTQAAFARCPQTNSALRLGAAQPLRRRIEKELTLCKSASGWGGTVMSWEAKFGGSAISAFALLGCASGQVNYNTLDIASTYDQLLTKQVTYNLIKTLDSRYSIPAFVKVTNQTAGTQYSITPNISVPITKQIQQLSQLQSAATGKTIQDLTTGQFAGKGLTVGATDQWNQTYTLAPVIDTGELRRLRVLYQYVTRTLAPVFQINNFEAQYPIIEIGTPGSPATGNTNTSTSITVTVDGKRVSLNQL